MARLLKSTTIIRLPERLTKAGDALAQKIESAQLPVITSTELYRKIYEVYQNPKGLYLRNALPDLEDYRRLRKNLRDANILAPDRDYGHRAYRVLHVSDGEAEDICCIVDRYCYVSHLSALQRYGLTNRRADALFLTAPTSAIARQMLKDEIEKESNTLEQQMDSFPKAVLPKMFKHPEKVRQRVIQIFQTTHLGKSIQLRGKPARMSTIGQTFLDMLEEPARCGGMSHVIEMWREHANTYLEEVLSTVDASQSAISKVRAGYILEEILNMKNEFTNKWVTLAQRGGSRRLDPTKEYAPRFSERWQISINV